MLNPVTAIVAGKGAGSGPDLSFLRLFGFSTSKQNRTSIPGAYLFDIVEAIPISNPSGRKQAASRGFRLLSKRILGVVLVIARRLFGVHITTSGEGKVSTRR